jgi:tetratricopeptide (TPR) repeat protein
MRRLAGYLSVLVVVAGIGNLIRAQGQSPARILVMPFENVKRDASIFWLGEASAVLLADDLNELGASAITREERREAFERLQVPPGTSLTDATVIRIGELVGASQVLTGSLQIENDVLVVRARAVTLETGRVSHDLVERGPVPEIFTTFERVARGMVRGKATGDAVKPRPPMAAFENYVKGLLAEVPETAISYLNSALALTPTFDRARLALWDLYAEQGDHAHALAAVLPVSTDSAWTRRGRFLAGLSYLQLNRNEEAFAIFTALADAQSTAAALNNAGVAQLRRGSASSTGATDYFKRAADTDPSDPDYFFNLGYGYWLARDPQAVIYWLREVVRRNPADGQAHFIMGTALASGGSSTEAAREKELARRLSSVYAQWEKRPAGEPVPKGLERVKDGVELPHARQFETSLAASGQRDQRELANFYLDRGRRLYASENDRDAVTELNRTLYLSPYEAEAHLLLGRIHLRNNRLREAIDALTISVWSAETLAARIALGDAYLQAKDVAAARAEAERALILDPNSTDARQLLEKIGSR